MVACAIREGSTAVNHLSAVTYMLKTVFNVEDGLAEDAAIRLYQRTALASGNLQTLKDELPRAFLDTNFSWKQMLCNQEYEVFDANLIDAGCCVTVQCE